MITPLSNFVNLVFAERRGESQVRSQVAWPTIPAMVRDTADRLGDAEAVVDGTRRVDFAKLSSRVTGTARARSRRVSGVAIGSRSGRRTRSSGSSPRSA